MMTKAKEEAVPAITSADDRMSRLHPSCSAVVFERGVATSPRSIDQAADAAARLS